MRLVTQDDINAAARGLNMVSMSVVDLRELAAAQNVKVFAGQVIRTAAIQMMRAKKSVGAQS